MDIKTVATILLLGRVVAVIFTILVIRQQVKLFKQPVYPELRQARYLYFGLAVGALLSNVIPVAIDILTLTSNVTRTSNHVNIVGLLYGFNACLASIFSSIFIWLLYRLAAKTVILVDRDKYEALTEM